MREMKFRAWNKINKTMNVVSSLEFVSHQDGRLHFIDAGWKSNPEDFDLMQYAGIEDKNGKEIYEGDVLEDDEHNLYKVVFSVYHGFVGMHKYTVTSSWTLDKNGEEVYSTEEEPIRLAELYFKTEVIGNIYENPELLRYDGKEA